MTALAVLWHAFTHAADVAWHGLLYVYAAAYGLWVASVAYNVACERLQKRRDRRAKLAAQLRDDVRTARARELPKAVIDEHLAVFDLALWKMSLPLDVQDPAIRGGAS